MKIFRVLGLALAIVVLRFLVPELFGALEKTLLTFFEVLQTVMLAGKNFSFPINMASPGLVGW